MGAGNASGAQVRLFGALEIEVGGEVLGPRQFGGIKPKQVLEIVVAQRGRTVAKDEIADSIWGEALPANVPRTLETYVSTVRSRLGDARRLLATETRGYRFDGAAARLDLDAFDDLLREAAAASGPERRDHLEAALAIPRGELLADEPYAAWALDLRGVYTERRVQATCDLAEVCLALGEARAAVEHAQAALVLDPLLERAHRCAMLGHYALGDEDRSLLAYERCRSSLSEGLGTTPTEQTAALHATVLRREDPRALIAQLAGDAFPAELSSGTSYAYHGEVALAYQTIGSGPPDLVFMPGFVSHVEAAWEDPINATFIQRLAAGRRVIIFDKRGTGLSDAVLEWPSFEERADDLVSVMDAAGSRRAALFGVSEGAPLCAVTAVRHPDRVTGIIMHAGFSSLLATAANPAGWTPEFFDFFLDRFDDFWMTGDGVEIMNPSVAGDQRYKRWLARYLRLSASPGMARRLMRMNAEIDIEELLGEIAVPTLITHRRDEQWVHVDNSRHLAARIPGARLVELEGVDHHPWLGDSDEFHRVVDGFIRSL